MRRRLVEHEQEHEQEREVITEQRTIKEPKRSLRPIDVAEQCYREWQGDVTFVDDLADYLVTGVVVSRPDFFVMAKAVEHEGELAWFIRMFVGHSLVPVLLALPPFPIERVCFCRRNDGRLRSYSIKRMLHLEKLGLYNKLKERDEQWAAEA